MRKGKKPKQLKIISILVFITLSFLATLFYIFLSEIRIVPILLKDYIDSGKSLFFPYIPQINILWFLTEKDQVIHLNLGQILDLIIIYNFINYIETNSYHYIKMAIINGDIQKYNYEELEANKDKDNSFSIYSNPKDYLENELRNIFKNISLNSTEKKNKKRTILNNQLKTLKFKFLNHLNNKNSKFILNKSHNNFLIFLNYSSFNDSWMSRPKNYYFPLDTNKFSYFNKIKQLEGN